MSELDALLAVHYPSAYNCGCGHPINSPEGWARHVAEVVAGEDDLTPRGLGLRELWRTGNAAVQPSEVVPCAREHQPGWLCILPDGHETEPASGRDAR